jgi:hypothetical protein
MEESQTIQQAFAVLGHEAYSCDLKPARIDPSRHFQGDVFAVLDSLDWTPDVMILHPVCRLLSVSGQHWIGKPGYENRAQERDEAIASFMRCVEVGKRARSGSCVENPISIMSTRYRKPDQILRLDQFGEDASKSTCLWLDRLSKLEPLPKAEWFPPRIVTDPYTGKLVRRWSNQTDSGQNRLGPTKDPEDRRAARAVTYPGPAIAMAKRWGKLS